MIYKIYFLCTILIIQGCCSLSEKSGNERMNPGEFFNYMACVAKENKAINNFEASIKIL